MKAIVVGHGEIGQAVKEVFNEWYEIDIYDIALCEYPPLKTYDVLLICFPYSELFVSEAKSYCNRFNAKAVIIFSTVAIGTTAQIPNAVHSPVEGKHPRLTVSIRSAPRWVGGTNKTAIEFLGQAGLELRLCDNPEATEFLKLYSTAKYGLNIEFARYASQVCNTLGINYEQVKQFDVDYNYLYEKLHMPQFQRYILEPPSGNIGGHCVVSNAQILDAQFPNLFLKEIYRNKEA